MAPFQTNYGTTTTQGGEFVAYSPENKGPDHDKRILQDVASFAFSAHTNEPVRETYEKVGEMMFNGQPVFRAVMTAGVTGDPFADTEGGLYNEIRFDAEKDRWVGVAGVLPNGDMLGNLGGDPWVESTRMGIEGLISEYVGTGKYAAATVGAAFDTPQDIWHNPVFQTWLKPHRHHHHDGQLGWHSHHGGVHGTGGAAHNVAG